MFILGKMFLQFVARASSPSGFGSALRRDECKHGQDGRATLVYLQPAFLICVVVLAMAAGVSGKLSVVKKEFLPLKKSFDALSVRTPQENEERLAPYKVVEKLKIENEEILEALGTQDYIQWVLEDINEPVDSAVKRLMLFVTYYGKPDRVPHVPEECYTGGGFQVLAQDDVTFNVKNARLLASRRPLFGETSPEAGSRGAESKRADFERKIEGEYRVFGSVKAPSTSLRAGFLRQRLEKFPVLYFFNVSGKYAGSRGKARFALNKNIFRKYTYFSKVELVFNQVLVVPSKEEAVAAAERLLAVLLPILEEDYWPDLPR